MLEFAEVTIGQGSPSPCIRCHPRDANAPAFLPAATVLEAVAAVANEWRSPPGPNVAFIGPEPFAHPELPLIVSGAAAAGFERIRLRTDAGALASGGNATGVLAAGVLHIEVILLGGDAATHDRVTGRPGLFDAAHAGVAAYRAAAAEPVAITGFVPVCRHTAPHLSETVRALAEWGAGSVELWTEQDHHVDPIVTAAAFQTATVNGMCLHGPGVPDAGIAPWVRRGVV